MDSTRPSASWATVPGIGGQRATVAISLKDRTQKTDLYVTMNPTPEQARPTLVFAIPPGMGLPPRPAEGLGPHAGEELPGIPRFAKTCGTWSGSSDLCVCDIGVGG